MIKTVKTTKSEDSMQQLVNELGSDLVPIKEGAIIEVKILAKSRNRILVDVAGICHGIILDKEFSVDMGELEPDDKILAYVLTPENDEGFAVLSLKKADKERFNQRIDQKFAEQTNIQVRIKQANKGGLIAEYGGIEGFLPVSQLSSEHYPKVGDDKNKILEKLIKFVGQTMTVKIINYDKEQNKLIFSEKAAMTDQIQERIKQFEIGQSIEGIISGVVDFGLFVDLNKIEGLAHISEISWDKIDNLKSLYKIGDKIKVQVIAIENNKVSLSIKRLLPDPWLNKIKEFKADSEIEGKVERITPFGVFIILPNKISGLVHISELTDKLKNGKNIEEILTIGKSYKFKISSIERSSHKINLILADVNNLTKKSKSKKDQSAKDKKKTAKKTKNVKK